MKQTLVGHKSTDDGDLVTAMTHWVKTQNMDSINRAYETLFHDFTLTLMWRGLCGKAFG
jgi:hypothetical protein